MERRARVAPGIVGAAATSTGIIVAAEQVAAQARPAEPRPAEVAEEDLVR
jgi:hypothetical protein